MAIDNFNPTLYTEEDVKLRDEDLWITSRANSLAKTVSESIEKLHFHKATRAINNFILEDLSRWYVRLIRGRTCSESEQMKVLVRFYRI